MPRFDVTAVGETMLRFSVPVGQRLETADKLDMIPGGAEGNLLAALARLGRRCIYGTALPDNPLGRLTANHLCIAGIDLSAVAWKTDGRMGAYYVEFSIPPRPIQVVYDRADSCAAHMSAADFDLDLLLDTRLLHITGITPALSPSCRALTGELINRARAAGVAVSFDVNYRSKLWPPDAAAEALTPFMQGADLLFCKAADARTVFGLSGEPDALPHDLASRLDARAAIVTAGEQGVYAWDGAQALHEAAVPITHIVDRLGAGDALAAGVIHAWLDGDLARGLRYGVVLAALALTQRGDMLITTPAELAALAGRKGGEALVR
jgi:2-dehydro-3-deoxygluconokinase